MKTLLSWVCIFLMLSSFASEKDRILTINPHGHKGTIRTMCIDKDKNIITAGYDKVIKIWDSEEGYLKREIYGQIGEGSERMIYSMAISPDDKYLAVGGWFGSTHGTEAVGDIRVYDYKSGKLLKLLEAHVEAVIDLEFASSKQLFSVDGRGNVILWDVSGYDMWQFKKVSSDVTDLAIMDEYFITSHQSGMVNMWLPSKPEKPIKSYNKLAKQNIPVSHVIVSPSGKRIALSSGAEIYILNGKLKDQSHFINGEDRITGMCFSPDDSRLLVLASGIYLKNNDMHLYEEIKGDWTLLTTYDQHIDLVLGAGFLDNNTCVTAGGKDNEIVIWYPLPDELYAEEKMKLTGVGNDFYSVAMDGKKIAFSTEWSKNFGFSKLQMVFDINSRLISPIKSSKNFKKPKVKKNGKSFDRQIKNGNRETLFIKRDGRTIGQITRNVTNGSLHNVSLFVGSKYVVSGGGYGFVEAYTLKGDFVSRFIGHTGDIWGMSISSDEKFLITCSNDQTIKIWGINSIGKKKIYPIVSIFISNENEWIIWNEDGYFTASKKGAGYVGYHINQGKEAEAKFYPFEQFDLKYNRPDIIMSDLALFEESTIDLYKSAYIKRLKKMGISEDDFSEDLNIPEITILSKKVNNGKIFLELQIEDKKSELNRINVFINDVPIFGRKGIDVQNENTKKITQKIDFDLMSGRNKIQISAMNNSGAESFKETFIIKNSKEVKPNLYVLSIGVSDYLDSNFNLNYAAKDAKDVNDLFVPGDVFKNVKHKLLVNNEVTKESILASRKFLETAGRDDIVLVFIAGHGVLDKDLNYYFCTYDIDFNNPSDGGIAYDKLEALFDGIAALKKLLIMDTCHSGEVDKDDIEEIAQINSELGEITFRSTNATTVLTEREGLKQTNEAVREMFNDLRRGTGATVISSAGGVEFAMESEEWQNGLFTYCLLMGIKSGEADLNHDNEIYLSELQLYLREKVIVLSKGKQQPTSRLENISLDYRIW